jgi:hypothetical protein
MRFHRPINITRNKATNCRSADSNGNGERNLETPAAAIVPACNAIECNYKKEKKKKEKPIYRRNDGVFLKSKKKKN